MFRYYVLILAHYSHEGKAELPSWVQKEQYTCDLLATVKDVIQTQLP